VILPQDDATVVLEPRRALLGDVLIRLKPVSHAARAALVVGLGGATFVSSAALTHCVRAAPEIPRLPDPPARAAHHAALHVPEVSPASVDVRTAAAHLFAGELGEAAEAYALLAQTESDVVFRVVSRALRRASAGRKGGAFP